MREFSHQFYRGLKTISWLSVAIIIACLDSLEPFSFAIPFLYLLVLLAAWADPSRYGFMVAAGICSGLIVGGPWWFFHPHPSSTDLINRGISLGILWCFTLFLWKQKRTEHEANTTIQAKVSELNETRAALQASIRHGEQTEQHLADLNRTLIEQNQELETIVSVASHDLRSPLINIKGFSKELAHSHHQLRTLLESHKLSPLYKHDVLAILEEDIPESLDYIQTGAKKMEALLEGILRFSRLGRLTLKFEELDMNTMIADIIAGMEYQLMEKGIALQVEDLPKCRGDATLVNQLFFNLIDNAQKYISPTRPGMIRITGIREEAYARYGIEDNGIGIGPDHQERIFQMFHRLNPTSTPGEGLGLTIVRRIVERHKGHIRLESQPDRGTTFTVLLPASQSST